MSEAKHTPGPWDINVLAGPNRTEVFAGNVLVCDTYSGTVADEEECKANARLIAAAPDLLAAAHMVTDWTDTSKYYFDSAIDALKSAIVKAEGRE